MAKPRVPCTEGIFSSSLQVPSDFVLSRNWRNQTPSFQPWCRESKLCLMRLLLCQPHCWEMISNSTVSVWWMGWKWTMLVIPRPMGWQERWDAHILDCKWDSGGHGAGKNSVLHVGVPATIVLVSSASRGWKYGEQGARIVNIPLRKSLLCSQPVFTFLQGKVPSPSKPELLHSYLWWTLLQWGTEPTLHRHCWHQQGHLELRLFKGCLQQLALESFQVL